MDENVTTPAVPGKEQPKKYIRTLAGDIETVKKGGTPDLAPLPERPAAKERLIAPSPISPNLPPIPVLTPRPLAPIPPPPPAVPPPVVPLETYAADFSERMKETHATAATVLAVEQNSGATSAQSSPQEAPSPRNLLYTIAGVILLLVGAIGAYIAYARYQAALAPVALAPGVSAPIFVDEREQIPSNGLAPLVAIQQSVARPLAPNAVRLLYAATTTAKSVFAQLPLSAPDILLRNVNAQGSMAGVVDIGGVQSPFFILSVSSYGDTFSGMLAWEPMMPRMLGSLFPAYPPAYAATSTATTTASTATVVATTKPGFYDEVVGNHDVRVYRDQAGRSIMLYGYWNQTTLVVARDPSAFIEILGRLATSRAQS